MAKRNTDYATGFPFFEALKEFYVENRGKIRRNYKDLTRKYLDYNDKEINPSAFLRKPQFEALEMYVFLKEFMDNKHVHEIFSLWKEKQDMFSEDYIMPRRHQDTGKYCYTMKRQNIMTISLTLSKKARKNTRTIFML